MTLKDWLNLNKTFKDNIKKVNGDLKLSAVHGNYYDQLFHLSDYTVIAHCGNTIYLRGKEKLHK